MDFLIMNADFVLFAVAVILVPILLLLMADIF